MRCWSCDTVRERGDGRANRWEEMELRECDVGRVWVRIPTGCVFWGVTSHLLRPKVWSEKQGYCHLLQRAVWDVTETACVRPLIPQHSALSAGVPFLRLAPFLPPHTRFPPLLVSEAARTQGAWPASLHLLLRGSALSAQCLDTSTLLPARPLDPQRVNPAVT